MYVQQVDNTSFEGFKFKSPHARKVFREKLSQTDSVSAQYIKEYMQQAAKEPVNVVIDATETPMYDSFRHVIFATIPNNDRFVVDPSYNPNSLKKFIDRCAAQAGFAPFRAQEPDDAQKLFKLGEKTLSTLKSIIRKKNNAGKPSTK